MDHYNATQLLTLFFYQGEYSKIAEKGVGVKGRDFHIHVLNDSLKNLQQRAAVIGTWKKSGGVLLMGYELYRQLANKKPRKKKQRPSGLEYIDIEEEDKNRGLLNGKFTFKVSKPCLQNRKHSGYHISVIKLYNPAVQLVYLLCLSGLMCFWKGWEMGRWRPN